VLRCLPEGAGVDEAERVAPHLVRDYLVRVKEGKVRRFTPDPDASFEIPRSWRTHILADLDPLSDAILRLHYGDGVPLEQVEKQVGAYKSTVAAAVDGLRESLRAVGSRDGDVLAGWTDARVDRLLGHIANLAEPGCPGPGGLLSEAGQTHADRCPRCSRAIRLLRGGVLAAKDLFPPPGNTILPDTREGIFALLVHPDAQKHKRRMDELLGDNVVPAGPDCWLVTESKLSAVVPVLEALCEDASPPRHHFRGALVGGPGRWAGNVPLGMVAVQAIEAARARPWSDVGKVCELPAPLPQPPKATGWWASAGALALVVVAVGAFVLSPSAPEPLTPLDAAFASTGTSWDVRFDTRDLAVVDLVALDGAGRLSVVRRDMRATKGTLSTGEGDYRMRVPGEAVAVLASPDGIADLDSLVDDANDEPAPLQALAKKVRAQNDRADVAVSPGGHPASAR
jgi:hypothetical protein